MGAAGTNVPASTYQLSKLIKLTGRDHNDLNLSEASAEALILSEMNRFEVNDLVEYCYEDDDDTTKQSRARYKGDIGYDRDLDVYVAEILDLSDRETYFIPLMDIYELNTEIVK